MATARQNRKNFSRWLDITMENEGLSGKELARRANVDEGSISRWRRGTANPGLESCERLADALGVDRLRLLVTAGLLSQATTGAEPLPIPPATALLNRVRQKLEELPGITERSVDEMLEAFRRGLGEEGNHNGI